MWEHVAILLSLREALHLPEAPSCLVEAGGEEAGPLRRATGAGGSDTGGPVQEQEDL